MNKTTNKKRTKRTQKDGWNKGVFTTKMRTSIYIDEDLGKLMKKKSSQSTLAFPQTLTLWKPQKKNFHKCGRLLKSYRKWSKITEKIVDDRTEQNKRGRYPLKCKYCPGI